MNPTLWKTKASSVAEFGRSALRRLLEQVEANG